MSKKSKRVVLLTMVAPIALCFANNSIKVNAKEAPLNSCIRIWGEDRYETAVEISKVGWNKGSECAFIVNGQEYADALSATPFARQKDSPILLTEKNNLKEKTLQELKRLKVSKVYIIGGQGVVSKEVEEGIKNNLGVEVERVYGEDRYETSIRVAERMGSVDKVFIASGEGYGDALSAAAVAAIVNAPIILTEKNKMPDCSKKYIKKNYDSIDYAYIVGGTASVDKNIETEFKNPKRLAGIDRYETNKEVLSNFESNLNFKKIFMARGEGNKGDEFADALAVSVLAAKEKSPVFLVNDTLHKTLRDFGKSKMFSASDITLLGGHSNIPDFVGESMKITAEIVDENSVLPDNEINNNVDIVGNNIVLKSKRIKGNLYIDSKGVLLSNVIVEGRIYVNTGEGNTVKFSNVVSNGTIVITGKVENVVTNNSSDVNSGESSSGKNKGDYKNNNGQISQSSGNNNKNLNENTKSDREDEDNNGGSEENINVGGTSNGSAEDNIAGEDSGTNTGGVSSGGNENGGINDNNASGSDKESNLDDVEDKGHETGEGTVGDVNNGSNGSAEDNAGNTSNGSVEDTVDGGDKVSNIGDTNIEGSESDVSNSTSPEAISVTDIKLERDTLEMSVGEEVAMAYTIFPENASNKNVSWYCDKTDILDVSNQGILKAKSPGQAKIVVTSKDKELKAECSVTIKELTPIELLRSCNSLAEVQKLLDDNKLILNIEWYNNINNSAKGIVASVIYDKKDIYESKEEIQQELDTMINRGYIIQGNTATLIEGIKSGLKNAVDNPLISNIYMYAGVYTLDNSLNIDRDVKIQGDGSSETKIEIIFSNHEISNVGISVSKNIKLDISDLTIDGQYSNGVDISSVLESQGFTTLKNIKMENVGGDYYNYGFGVKASAGILKIDNCIFSDIQKSAIVSSYDAVLNIGTDIGNIFEGKLSDDEVSAIVTRNTGETYIFNNIIRDYEGSHASGLNLKNGGRYTVKNNIITGNTIGIKAASTINVNSNTKDKIDKILLEGNPECKDNLLLDIQISN